MAASPGTPLTRRSFRIAEASIVEHLAGLEHSVFTSRELVETYIARIDQVNSEVHAVSFVNRDALAIAEDRDRERKAGVIRGRLHGVPIMYKDVYLTLDTTPTTVGCTGLLHAKAKYEATVIAKLRDSGAILLGSTVPTQWANYRSVGQAPNGWSAVGGQCRGVFRPDQDPGGSSAGSAVAVALGLTPAALGAETSGSLASPARSAGVVAIKPTKGLTSQHGTYIVSRLQDSTGVLARSVLDAATVLSVIAGPSPEDVPDPRDGGETIDTLMPDRDFAASCRDDGLDGLKIAVPRHIINRDEFVTKVFGDALRVMEGKGATIVEGAKYSEWSLDMPNADKLPIAMRVDLIKNMDAFLESFDPNPKGLHSFADVMNYTASTPEEENDQWGMKEWESCASLAKEHPPGSQGYRESLELQLKLSGQISELLDRHGCDVIAAPWWTNTTAAIAGCPQVSVPLPVYPDGFPDRRLARGMVTTGEKIPTGILFVGRRWDDHKVIRAAHAFDVATRHRDAFGTWISSSVELPDAKAKV